MALPTNRTACMSDLRDYFKISNLFGELTTPQREIARRNLGIVGNLGVDGELPVMDEISHMSLWDIIQRKELIPGASYIIKDFRTIYKSNVKNGDSYISWGTTSSTNPSPVQPLIVTAISEDRLDSRAFLKGKEWVIEYNITPETLEDGVKTLGKITYLRDERGNSAYYDFKSIKFRRTRSDMRDSTINMDTQYKDFYTFSIIQNGEVLDRSEMEECESNTIKERSWNNVFLGETKNNIFEAEFQNNTFISGCINNHLMWGTKNNFFHEQVAYTTGTVANKVFLGSNTVFSFAVTKQLQQVYDKTLITFLDPSTYAQQIVFI